MSVLFSEVIFKKINETIKYSKNDNSYYCVNDLFLIKDYVKGYNNNKKKFITEKFNTNDIIIGRIIMNNEIVLDKKYSPKFSKYFVKCESVLKEFQNYKNKNKNVKLAPSILEEQLCLFKDKNGIEYHVEIRGERTKDEIYFKCKDLENIFEMNNLCKNVLDNTNSFNENEDFLLFNVSVAKEVLQTKQNQVFLTFSGLMKVIRNSRTGRAKEFSDWLDEIVFSTIAGDDNQRLESACKVMNSTFEDFKKMMNKHASKISCIYVLKTNIKVGNDIIYKYGFSNDLDRRVKEHEKILGDVELESFILISNEFKSQCENHFKDSMSGFNKKYDLPGFESMSELLFLNSETKKLLKDCLSNLSAKYSEDNQILIRELNQQISDIKTKYELQILKLEYENKLLKQENDYVKRENQLKDKLLTLYENK